jgi:predicted nucleotidyltransferase
MNTNDILSKTLFSKARGRVLAELFARPAEDRNLSQLSRACGIGKSEAQRELRALARAGIVQSRKLGNQVFYSPDAACCVLAELRALVEKTWGVAGQLRQVVALLPVEKVRFAAIYGSAAKGQMNQGSDIDLLVLGEISLAELVGRLQPVQQALGREINPSVFSVREFKASIKEGKHFAKALRDGRDNLVFLRGDAGDLEAMA